MMKWKSIFVLAALAISLPAAHAQPAGSQGRSLKQ
jgi:hypothetical protein